MQARIFKVIISFFIVLPTIALAHLPTSVNGKAIPSLAPMLKHTTPAIVNITVEKKVSFGDIQIPQQYLKHMPKKMIGLGSGVIINAAKGLIVTNAHVVKNARIIVVSLKDGRRFRANLVGESDGFDIAIIKIKADDLTQIQFADSDNLKVGDFVAAIGSPFGLSQTVTSGVISALNRSRPKIEGFQSFIQTDAPINPGNSGGALVNMQGKMIGMNTAIFTPVDANVGIGFAIPSDMVQSVVQQLLKYGKVKRGVLGVVAQNITPELASAFHLKNIHNGTIVTQVMPDSPAANAGIKVQDVIETVDNRRVFSSEQLHNTLGMMRPGTKIHITLLRDHKPLTLDATVADPTHMLQRAIPFLAGTQLRDFNELEGDGTTIKGALVTGVSELSDAALAGLDTGDVITAANGKEIEDANDLKNIAMSHPHKLLLTVNRNNMTLFVIIQ